MFMAARMLGWPAALRAHSFLCRAASLRLSGTRTAASSALGSAGVAGAKQKLVFLGTPEVAAGVLARIMDAAEQPSASFEVAAVVTQPARLRGRVVRGGGSSGRKSVQPSPVAALALERGIAPERILAPETARDEAFLKALAELRPDLCVTAAYGNILPYAFLVVPRCGTLNVHPSLLPRYRGAAPVQRALQDGVAETGVSVAFTVKAMDAGPVLARETMAVDAHVQAPELLEELFARGTRLLLQRLPDVWSGRAREVAEPQDDAQASTAPKLAMEEGMLDFREPALTLHNKVRAFAGWPGTRHVFLLQARTAEGCAGADAQELELKILRTRVAQPGDTSMYPAVWEGLQPREVAIGILKKDRLLVRCGSASGEGDAVSVLEILELQPSARKAMEARAFINGLKGRQLYWQPYA